MNSRLGVADALRNVRRALTTTGAEIATLQTDNAAKAAEIAALQAENATLSAALERQAQIDEARWVLEHAKWPDGRLITPAEKAAAAALLNDDRVARSRHQLGGPR